MLLIELLSRFSIEMYSRLLHDPELVFIDDSHNLTKCEWVLDCMRFNHCKSYHLDQRLELNGFVYIFCMPLVCLRKLRLRLLDCSTSTKFVYMQFFNFFTLVSYFCLYLC